MEGLAGRQSHRGLGGRDLLVEDDVPVPGGRACRLGRGRGDLGSDHHQRRAILGCHGLVQAGLQRVRVLGGLAELDGMPAVGAEAGRRVVGEGEVGDAVDGHQVVVVDDHQTSQAQVPGQRGRLVADAFGQVAVAGDHEHAVVADPGAEAVAHLALGYGHAHRVGQALSQRSGGDLHARCAPHLRVARRGRSPLPEVPQVVQFQTVAGEVQQGVLQDRGVARRQHEPVAVGPVGALGVIGHDPGPQHVGQRGEGHGRALVARPGRVGRVHGQRLDDVDAEPVDGSHRPSRPSLPGHCRLTIEHAQACGNDPPSGPRRRS